MDELQKALKIAFASEYAFALKAQNFHWNVEGPLFPQLHMLFDTIYSEVYESIDPFAENIRKIGAFTPASFSRFSVLTMIDDETEILHADQMVAELLQDSEKMQEMFKIVFMAAEELGEHGLSNFLADRQDAHAKHSWMLRSTLK
ncbi:Dps DNA-binding ferritin-like protein (oxidative damage protectant) [uncultured Caudovirales phage]|jgi:starvation-inducible DNA-binding protein|uniref:Dps DNA-binding ferritin-like protein (Oxidative damage protectant) n=1 Tax=uncultured Caudovirales phage TaxID=2100421 RepID=A0A6J5LJX0_9CAUD|nr:Dps DNA-binding ferritin-like protein (oxidative damage protectant) [uncultured Caudovirales phage]